MLANSLNLWICNDLQQLDWTTGIRKAEKNKHSQTHSLKQCRVQAHMLPKKLSHLQGLATFPTSSRGRYIAPRFVTYTHGEHLQPSSSHLKRKTWLHWQFCDFVTFSWDGEWIHMTVSLKRLEFGDQPNGHGEKKRSHIDLVTVPTSNHRAYETLRNLTCRSFSGSFSGCFQPKIGVFSPQNGWWK